MNNTIDILKKIVDVQDLIIETLKVDKRKSETEIYMLLGNSECMRKLLNPKSGYYRNEPTTILQDFLDEYKL